MSGKWEMSGDKMLAQVRHPTNEKLEVTPMNRSTTLSRTVDLLVSRCNCLQLRLVCIAPFLIITCCGCFYQPLPKSLAVKVLNESISIDPIDSGPQALSGYTWYVYGTQHRSPDYTCDGSDTLLWMFEVDEAGDITRVQVRDAMYSGLPVRRLVGDDPVVDGNLHEVPGSEAGTTYVAETYGHSDGDQFGIRIIVQGFLGPFLVAQGAISVAGELDESGESFTGVMTVSFRANVARVGSLFPDSFSPPGEEEYECPIVGTRQILASATWNEESPPPALICEQDFTYGDTCSMSSGTEHTFSVQAGRPLTIMVTPPSQASRPQLSIDGHSVDPDDWFYECSYREYRDIGEAFSGFTGTFPSEYLGANYPSRHPPLTYEYHERNPIMGETIADDGTLTIRVVECEPGVVGDYTLTVIQAP
jgi:hypothetical protein